MPDISTLVDDIYHVLSDQNNHEASEENLEVFANNLKDLMRDFLRVRERKGSLRFSALGKQPRQLWYDQHADPTLAEKMPPQAMLKFLYGNIIEEAVLFLAKEAGHDVSCTQEEVEVCGIKGHMDAVIDGHLIDVKSASPYSFKKFEAGELQPEDDSFGYIRQLSGYATVKQIPAAFLVIDKVSGKIVLSPLSEYTVRGHPPEPRIEYLKNVLDQPQPPERCFPAKPEGKSGNMALGMECGYCKWKKVCWPEARGFAYSSGPKYLVKITRQPDVPEFEL